MPTIGLIAEYNPFHNGHLWQLREIRRRFPGADIVVAMSGALTQRGSVAVLDKWKRAGAAVRHGASLVLELPAAFATRSAQYFAGGGVRLLDRLGVIDILAFGAECNDLPALARMAREADAEEKTGALKKKLRAGNSYAAALTGAAAPDAAIRQPNVILAVEYLRALSRFASPILPCPLPRLAAAHHDTALPASGARPVASASSIRAALARDTTRDDALRAVPADVAAMLASGRADTSRLLRPILARLLSDAPDALTGIEGVAEGLENRLRRAALAARSYDELIEAVRAKRYSRARVRRVLLHILLGLSTETARRLDDAGPLYARPLAFDDKGRKLLRAMAKRPGLPVLTKPARFLAEAKPPSLTRDMLLLDLRATALASLASEPVGTPAANADFLTSPLWVR